MSGRDSNVLLSRSDFIATGVLVETGMAWSDDHVPPRRSRAPRMSTARDGPRSLCARARRVSSSESLTIDTGAAYAVLRARGAV